jgi:hypothetical protein
MSANEQFTHAAETLLAVQYSMLEEEILYHWERECPKKRAALVADGALRKTVKLYARSIIGVQKGLEECGLERPLARMEAWAQLMRESDDDEEEAAAWGITLEEYRNRESVMDI